MAKAVAAQSGEPAGRSWPGGQATHELPWAAAAGTARVARQALPAGRARRRASGTLRSGFAGGAATPGTVGNLVGGTLPAGAAIVEVRAGAQPGQNGDLEGSQAGEATPVRCADLNPEALRERVQRRLQRDLEQRMGRRAGRPTGLGEPSRRRAARGGRRMQPNRLEGPVPQAIRIGCSRPQQGPLASADLDHARWVEGQRGDMVGGERRCG